MEIATFTVSKPALLEVAIVITAPLHREVSPKMSEQHTVKVTYLALISEKTAWAIIVFKRSSNAVTMAFWMQKRFAISHGYRIWKSALPLCACPEDRKDDTEETWLPMRRKQLVPSLSCKHCNTNARAIPIKPSIVRSPGRQ